MGTVVDIWIRYLRKKEILRKGINNFENNEEEIKEFKGLLYRIKKKEIEEEKKKVEKLKFSNNISQ